MVKNLYYFLINYLRGLLRHFFLPFADFLFDTPNLQRLDFFPDFFGFLDFLVDFLTAFLLDFLGDLHRPVLRDLTLPDLHGFLPDFLARDFTTDFFLLREAFLPLHLPNFLVRESALSRAMNLVTFVPHGHLPLRAGVAPVFLFAYTLTQISASFRVTRLRHETQ